jgi:AsmA protein
MRKPAKIILWIVGIVALLVVVALLGLKLYLTKDRIMAWVIPPLEENLHRKVAIDDAGAGFTGIYLDGLDVRAEGAGEALVSARTLRIRWNLWALLSRKVEVAEVRLVEPRIHVVRLADGTLDIQDLLSAEGEGEASEPPAAKPEPAGEGGGPPVAVAVALVSMENGRVSFEDRTQTPARTYTLDAIDIRVTDISLETPLRYELSAQLPLAEEGRFSAEGTVNPATRDVTALARIKDFDLPSLNAVLGEGTTRFASGVFGITLDVKIGGGERADLKGTLGIAKLVLASEQGQGEPFDVSLKLDAGAELAQGTAVLHGLDVEVAEQAVHVEGKATGLNARPRIEFLVESLELRTDAFGALAPPGPETPAEEAAATPGEAEPAAEPTPIPLDAFGDVRLGKLLAGALVVENFTARIELDKGVLSIQPAGASIYGGTLALGARAELEKQGPPFESTVELNGTEVGAFLAGLNPKLKDSMTGTLALSLEASGLGGDLQALRSKTKAEAKDGKLLNHPLVMKFAQLFQVKELETLNFYSLKADVETAEGVGEVKALVLNGPNLQATGKGTVGLVEQNLDMVLAVAVPREIAAKLVKQRDALDAVTDKEGWARLPMRLAGSLDDPKYGLDTEALATAAAKAYGDKAKKVLDEKVLKKLPVDEEQKGLLDKGVKKLLGR